jgi:hypothetical protein
MSEAAEARVWYFFNGEAQVGPITEQELQEQIREKTVLTNHHVYRDGFENWKLLADVPDLMKFANSGGENTIKRSAPRAPIYELVVAHNDRHIVSGTLRNISLTGLFFETLDQSFDIDEEIKLILKEGRGLGKPMNLRGVVVRRANDERFARGYGLELRDLDEKTQTRIVDYIKRNQSQT